MRRWGLGIVAWAVLSVLHSSGAAAAVVTFQNLVIDQLSTTGVHTEAGFNYEATIGLGWEIQGIVGNPPSALATFFDDQASSVGDTVEFTKVGGGQFNFDSVDWRTLDDFSVNDQVSIVGYLSGSPTYTLVLNALSVPFQTAVSGFGGPIDLLKVEVTSTGNARFLDNFTFSDVDTAAVPEPASLSIWGLGLIGIAGVAWRKRKPVR